MENVNKSWAVYIDVIPLDDLNGHMRGGTCWCNPVFRNNIFVHNAADMREEFETNAVHRGNAQIQEGGITLRQ